MEISEHIQGILDNLPPKPGCYMMKDDTGDVIYVGKAINLRSRVRSYFHASVKHGSKTNQMVRRISDIEWIIVDSELEALILENNLIKKHRPQFNVRLKDDKTYPYIKVHWADRFPKVTVTRRMVLDGSRYFGPYTSVWAVHQTMGVLRRIFPYLTCDREITGEDKRACLYHDIKLCRAPCIGAIEHDQYRQMIDDLCSFLDGRTEKIVARMRLEMENAAEGLRFERAATLRDQITAIETIVERQKVVSSEYIDSDVLALARSNGDACVQVFFIRGGKLIGRDYFLLEGALETSDSDVMAEFMKQFYDKAPKVPSQVLLPHEVEEARIIRQWLRQKHAGQKIEILVPRRGKKRDLVLMATENAVETLNSLQARWQADRHRQEQALSELQEALALSEPLNRIECYDISNTQGTAAVGSMVVFEGGVPKKKLYRRFNIRSVVGPDDFASMEEVLTRRFNRWLAAKEMEVEPGYKPNHAFALLPDLLIVDGGKGQLGRAVEVLERFDLSAIVPAVGLAKQNEEIFLPGKPRPIQLPSKSQGLYLLQRMRDEAHRFAISSHRKRRTKEGLASRLEAIQGIGPAKRKALLNHFGSIERIKKATIAELSAVQGITLNLANAIKDHLE
ncbi:MAG TPA: excinuclease ABC subunit UvrC [Anaerolineales bacterium]|nr:excinuclease ABC subunit UvrC [Anaerolineales bacterium]